MSERVLLQGEVPETLAGERLDRALARMFPEHSRVRLTRWIRDGRVRLDGRLPKPRDAVTGGEQVVIEAEPERDERCVPQDIPLDIVYEDTDLLVLDKPPGLVVHPAAGHATGTLQNALLHHDPALAEVPRAGIVHRLDKDTSGLMVVARTLEAHTELVRQLQARSVRREYLALVQGELVAGGTVEAPIGRHPVDRKRQAVTERGREAVSHYRIERRYQGLTLLRVSLETGRTHQIRVHMAHIQHPLVGDPVYGGRRRIPKGLPDALRERLLNFPRQALHAETLGLRHPRSGEPMQWRSPPPPDMAGLLAVLEEVAR